MKLRRIETSKGDAVFALEDVMSVSQAHNMTGYGGAAVGKYRISILLSNGSVLNALHEQYKTIGDAFDEAGIKSVELVGDNHKTIVNLTHVTLISRAAPPNTQVIGTREQAENLDAMVMLSDGTGIHAASKSPNIDMLDVLRGIIEDEQAIQSQVSGRDGQDGGSPLGVRDEGRDKVHAGGASSHEEGSEGTGRVE